MELFFDNHPNSSNLKPRESAANSEQISSNGSFKDRGANENRLREKIAQIQIAREEDERDTKKDRLRREKAERA